MIDWFFMYDFIIDIYDANNWEKHRLGDLSKIVRGASPRPIKNPKWFDENSDIGWLRIADVTKQNGKIHFLEQHLSKLGQEKTRILKSPHLLLSIAATVGSPVINYIPTGVHDGFLIFLNPKFDKLFMFQWLQYFKNYWNKYGQPGSQVNLNSDLVRNQQIYIPAKKEQIIISDLFSILDNLLTVNQHKLEQLKLLKKALLQQLFPQNDEITPQIRFANFQDNWERHKLSDLFLIKAGGDLHKEELSETGIYPVISNSLEKNGIIGYSNSFKFDSPTITVTGRGSIGHAISRHERITPVIRVLVLIPKNKINVDFTTEYINRIEIYNESTGVPQLTAPQLGIYKILVPSFKETNLIGCITRKMDLLINKSKYKISILKSIKKALLQNMFI
ncbi:restriction endonuclease subunit S [Fructilactobacillus carniphilus]|uniref:Restriction endonuclease subunit S n=1 Tax=Fructilactobacillus carniphilus TaxID=2940297 RepID=A0ABY5BVX3_9LACO|nr:restriction endonuclease subunit S [Fructilactobacillus carniphilus]USS90654.1 restriction endonuclease subunit S [Fructilactobacillus carniphilus]